MMPSFQSQKCPLDHNTENIKPRQVYMVTNVYLFEGSTQCLLCLELHKYLMDEQIRDDCSSALGRV